MRPLPLFGLQGIADTGADVGLGVTRFPGGGKVEGCTVNDAAANAAREAPLPPLLKEIFRGFPTISGKSLASKVSSIGFHTVGHPFSSQKSSRNAI